MEPIEFVGIIESGLSIDGGTMISQFQDSRDSLRYLTQLHGTLVVDRVSKLVEVVDISRIGACTVGNGMPGRGTEVVLRVNDFEVVATVAWSHGSSCGLNFHRAIEPLAVMRENMLIAGGDSMLPGSAMRAPLSSQAG